MKRILITLGTFIIAVSFVISCGQVKDKPDIGDTSNAVVNASNDQLSKYPIEGFKYKSAKLPQQQWQQWAKVAAPIVKEILEKIPDGYVLEVRGHTDASGPEEPVGNKPGNLKISEARAKTVYHSLKVAGIKSKKLTARGVGSSELLPGIDPRSPKQRRVTFVVVPE